MPKAERGLRMLAAVFVLLLFQGSQLLAQGEKPSDGGEPNGQALLQLCGDYAGNEVTQQTLPCLAYVAGLVDGIRYYEGAIKLTRGYELLIHLNYFARVGELPSSALDRVRSFSGMAETATGLAKIQAEAVAKGSGRSTPAFADLDPSFTAIQRVICLPDGYSNRQGALVIVKFLRDHPERLHEPRPGLAFLALQAAFPCPQEDEKAAKADQQQRP